MRVTSNMMSRNLLLNINSSQGNLLELQNQLSSGDRVTKPSDDPAGTHDILGLKTNLAMINQLKSNADGALSFMGTTDSTLSNVSSMLQRAYELALQGANGTNNQESRDAIADEVDQIAAQVQTLANTKVGDKFIFSGTATDNKPIPSTSAPYGGNNDPIKLDMGNNSNIDISVDGETIFVTPPVNATYGLLTTTTGGITTTGVLDKLSAALRNPASTVSDISGYADEISANIDNVVSERASLGAKVNRVQAISSQMNMTNINLTQNLSTVQDTDVTKAILEFQSQQNTYQAALSVGTKIIQPSLVDFMK